MRLTEVPAVLALIDRFYDPLIAPRRQPRAPAATPCSRRRHEGAAAPRRALAVLERPRRAARPIPRR